MMLSILFKLIIMSTLSLLAHSLHQYLNKVQSMLSDKELRSFIKLTDQSLSEPDEGDLLDLSHKELRKMANRIDLAQIHVSRIDASYNYFKDIDCLNLSKGISNANSNMNNSNSNNSNSNNSNSNQNSNSKNNKMQLDCKLEWLDLSFNFIQSVEEIGMSKDLLANLKYLNVSANKIEAVSLKPCPFPFLQSLHLKNNRIKFFTHCPNSIEILTLDHNLLSSIAFTGGDALNVLSADSNLIEKVGINSEGLMFVSLQNNRITDLDAVVALASNNKNLLSINCRDNDVARHKHYKVRILENCDRIVQIDEIMISPHVREGFRILKSEEQLTELIEQTNKGYEARLQEKFKIKEEYLKQLQDQSKEVEDKFYEHVQQEKMQILLLENHAKNILAKNKMSIPAEQQAFQSKVEEMEYLPKSSKDIVTKEAQAEKLQNKHLKQFNDYCLNKMGYQKYQEQHTDKSIQNPKRKSKRLSKEEISKLKKQYIKRSPEQNARPKQERKRQSKRSEQYSPQPKDQTPQSISNTSILNNQEPLILFNKGCIPLLFKYYVIQIGEQGNIN